MKTLKNMESYTVESLGVEGLIMLLIDLQAFFFWDGHTKEVRQQVKACIDNYMYFFGDKIQWSFDPKGWQ